MNQCIRNKYKLNYERFYFVTFFNLQKGINTRGVQRWYIQSKEKSDLFDTKIGAFLGKNKLFLFLLRVGVLVIFFTALLYGFIQPDMQKYHLSVGLFWSFFWPFFMVVSLGTFGSVFCGICPHGFLGKYISRFGLQKSMPHWMQNPLIGLSFLVLGYWFLLYLFPDILKSPLITSLFLDSLR